MALSGTFGDGAREALVAEGCLQSLYAAMDAHLSSPTVQEEACGALANLAVGKFPGNAQKSLNTVAIVATDGLKRLYAAMDSHLTSAGVQEQACRALFTIVAMATIPEGKRSYWRREVWVGCRGRWTHTAGMQK